MTTDLARLRADALYAVESGDPFVSRLGTSLLHILDDPSLILPRDHALVKKPELLGKGVPA